MSNRFNSFKKGISKVKNISPKIKSKNSSKNNSKSGSQSSIEYIVPENSPLRKNSSEDSDSGFVNSDYLDDVDFVRSGEDSDYSNEKSEDIGFVRSGENSNDSDSIPSDDYSDKKSSHKQNYSNNESDDLNYFNKKSDDSNFSDNDLEYDLDGVDSRYTKYIFGDIEEDENYRNPRDSNFMEDYNRKNNYVNDLVRKKNFNQDYNGNYNGKAFKNIDNDLDNNDENHKNNSYLDDDYADFSFRDDLDNNSILDDVENEYYSGDLNNKFDGHNKSKQSGFKFLSNDIKNRFTDFKRSLLNKDDHSKKHFGKIVFALIILVLISSIFYFFVYQPFQDELNLERNSKLNELNTLYKGPLEVHENAYTLKSQIESENDINELKMIDILRYATKDWRNYHSSRIVSSRDNFGRVMLVYGDENKNIIMSVKDANEFVQDNDARVLSNICFEKVDTTIVPISISRLQATAGLISVGSIVDIYTLEDNYSSYDYGDSANSADGGDLSNSAEGEDLSESGGLNDSQLNSPSSEDSSTDSEIPPDNENSLNDENIADSSQSVNYGEDSSGEDSGFSAKSEPDVSGATVLAILRSKDSGVIDSSISKSNTLIDGNVTHPYENTSSYSNDVEELLKASVFNSYDNSNALESYLDSYGIKLSNYERMSNLADLDSEYLVLLEVPRSDVSFVINNMDNLILTIPTEFAPNWVVGELNETYYENIYNYDVNQSSILI